MVSAKYITFTDFPRQGEHFFTDKTDKLKIFYATTLGTIGHAMQLS